MSAPPAWPGAWHAACGGADAIVGDVDRFAAPLPPPTPRDRAEAGLRVGEARRLFLRRRGLLRLLVGHRLGLAPAGVTLGHDDAGAPTMMSPAGPPSAPPFVSVSARGGLAAFALADRPVGIDIEPLRDPGPLDAALTAEERAALAAAPASARIVTALRYWTAKEAYLKAIRTGLLRDPAGITVVAEGRDGFVIHDGSSTGRGRWWAPPIDGTPLVMALHVDNRGTD